MVPISAVRVRERHWGKKGRAREGPGDSGHRKGRGRLREVAAAPARTRSGVYTGISCAFVFAPFPFLELIFWKIKRDRQRERKTRRGRDRQRGQWKQSLAEDVGAPQLHLLLTWSPCGGHATHTKASDRKGAWGGPGAPSPVAPDPSSPVPV